MRLLAPLSTIGTSAINDTSNVLRRISAVQQFLWDHGLFNAVAGLMGLSPPLNESISSGIHTHSSFSNPSIYVVGDCIYISAEGAGDLSPCSVSYTAVATSPVSMASDTSSHITHCPTASPEYPTNAHCDAHCDSNWSTVLEAGLLMGIMVAFTAMVLVVSSHVSRQYQLSKAQQKKESNEIACQLDALYLVEVEKTMKKC